MCYSVQEPVLLAGGKRSNNVFVGCWHAFPEVHQLRGDVIAIANSSCVLPVVLQGWLPAERSSAGRLMQGWAGC